MEYEKIKGKLHYIFNQTANVSDSVENIEKLVKGEFLNIKDETGNWIKPIYRIEKDWELMTETEVGAYTYVLTMFHTFYNFKIEWTPFIKTVYLYTYPDEINGWTGEPITFVPQLDSTIFKIIEYDKNNDRQTIQMSRSVRARWYGSGTIQSYGKFIIYVYNPNLIL